MTNKKAQVKKYTIHKVDFKKLRKRAGLTQAELARKMGIFESQICKYENGYLILTEQMWNNIKKVLDKNLTKNVNML